MIRRIVLIGVLALGVVIPAIGLSLAVEAARAIDIGETEFLWFIGAIAVTGGTAIAVGVAILWQKPGNLIGILLAAGGLLLTSVFASWPIGILQGADGGSPWSGFLTWFGSVALLPAVVLLFPAVGIIFPDGRLPGPRWRWPVAAGAIPLAVGVVLQTIFPWRPENDVTPPDPAAVRGFADEASNLGGALAVLGTFILFAIAVAAVVVRYRRSTGVERAQQKWLVATLSVMAIAFPVSYGTDIGPDLAIDVLGVLAGALIPVSVGIAILRYHLFEIDRLVSRTISYGLLTTVLVAVYVAVILVLQGPLVTILGGDTVSVALSTLIVAALFQPLRVRIQRIVDRRFDRARFDADRTTAAFSERLRDEVDIAAVTEDLDQTVREALKPSAVDLWLRDAGRVTS